MSTAGRQDGAAPAASDVAARLRDAAFVRLVAAADGDALAALGVLAEVLDATDTPYQASVAGFSADASRATEADLTVALGCSTATADVALGVDCVASETAYAAAADVGTPDPDPVLALAGVVAGRGEPEGRPLADARAGGLERRPGLAIPVTDPVDGLAHSTLVHGPFSGAGLAADSPLAALDRSGDRDEESRRRLASVAALEVAGEEATTARGAAAVERLLRPYAGGPFETVGGYADVLEALAREQPGLGVAVALGNGDREAALGAWREHGLRAHAAVREARTGRYDGLFVARCDDAPVGTVARLVRDFRSPEPVVLVVTDGEAAAVRTPDGSTDVGARMRAAAAAVDGVGAGTATRAGGQFEGDRAAFVLAFREAR